MSELANCVRCGDVFAKQTRNICPDCYKEEEEAFDKVYRFLRDRKNREATLDEINRATGVEKDLIIKFIKERRLRTSDFPKLAYPCERCGVDIVSGRICSQCSEEILDEWEHLEKQEQREKERKERQKIYYTLDKHRK
ncbi:MAG TPA: TIGR03826 family flagellar region protein [Bacillota bacterium]|nr:TIGR03826 family flagellar region protein [Bacillota bacterium]